MAAKIFDKDTLLDLTVNIVPLGIIAGFIALFAVYDPFGYDTLGTPIMYGLMLFPFVGLAILTYLSGKAIAGDEKRSEVYLAGAATVPGAETLEEYEERAHSDGADALEEADDESAESDETSETDDDDLTAESSN
ncbi:hypothetical protein SAMN04487949_1029 [Halogranum gelatinilyticum]|uniref:Cox cluster protein n=1 Tax=Halogranum gelatinilyticum TaxID=660521 RepID=A0A1G9QU85_9EURY|nr:DUF6684 family protein [Halogranum gelatinilyticum]SDM14589.1 hypothetical protein SAMN04487949_1029 [Halogranum gelatinilyticum]